ncbi:four-carbon acid sugar kinase family protein, partial [Escherichia coli]
MEKGITKPSILVVADDFTGANDAGVSLAQVGHTVDVAFEMHYRGDASV